MAIDDLISVAKDGTTAIMCAEFTLEMSSIIDRGRTGCSEHRNGAYHERLRADENTHRRDGPTSTTSELPIPRYDYPKKLGGYDNLMPKKKEFWQFSNAGQLGSTRRRTARRLPSLPESE